MIIFHTRRLQSMQRSRVLIRCGVACVVMCACNCDCRSAVEWLACSGVAPVNLEAPEVCTYSNNSWSRRRHQSYCYQQILNLHKQNPYRSWITVSYNKDIGFGRIRSHFADVMHIARGLILLLVLTFLQAQMTAIQATVCCSAWCARLWERNHCACVVPSVIKGCILQHRWY